MAEVTAARPRVLVVDDELGVRESLRAILQGECDVLTANTGDKALALVAQQPVDIMTLDLRMPGLGGIDVLQRVKQVDPDIEVLIITGNGSLDSAVEGLRLRAFDYLTKPFDSERVRELVHNAMARRAAVHRVKAVPERLLSNLSHELRTPLNVIMGYSTILQEESEVALSDEQRLALDRIQSNSSSLLAYIDTIFYIAALDRGDIALTPAAITLPDLFAGLERELAPRAREKGIGWRVTAPADLRLSTDADRLQRILRALLDNAVRYTTEGEVTLTAAPTTGGAVIEVRDSGPGMGSEMIAEMERLLRGGDTARPPRLLGFGLRLAIRLVRSLGALLTTASDSTGTICRIVLPDLVTVRQDHWASGAAA